MKHEGFDHVRVPIGWHHYAGPAPDFTLSPEIFSRVDFVVTNALENKLAVMINIHHFDELDQRPGGGHGGISENLAANRGALPKISRSNWRLNWTTSRTKTRRRR